jgi:hypothetical protein
MEITVLHNNKFYGIFSKTLNKYILKTCQLQKPVSLSVHMQVKAQFGPMNRPTYHVDYRPRSAYGLLTTMLGGDV